MQFQTNSKNFNVPIVCPKPRVHQYQEQRDDLELTIKAVGGEVKISRFIAEFSGFFSMVIEKRENFKDGPIHYDGTEGSVAFDVKTCQTFWNIGHGIKVDLNLVLILDLVRFLQYEDKFKQDDGFEKPLWEELMKALESFNESTKLAVSFILTTFHNPNDYFAKKYAEKVAFDYVKKMAWDWNSKTGQNKQLVEYYAALNDLTFEKADSDFCSKLLCFSKKDFSKHFASTKSKEVFLKLESPLSCLEIKKGDKIVVNGPLKRIVSTGKEMPTGVELEVTSDREEINGKYVIVGERHGCPFFKRATPPYFFVYKEQNNDGTVIWKLTQGQGFNCTKVKSDTSLPPESGYSRYNTKITISKYKNKTP